MSRKSKALEFADVGYNIAITGRNVQVTDPMKDYAMEKISKIEKFTHQIIDVKVTMDIQRAGHEVDIVMKAGHIQIVSRASTDDMYASIDLAVNKLQTQLRRYKKRIQEHQARGIKSIDMNVNVIKISPEEDELLEINEEIEAENEKKEEELYKPHEIVQRDTMPLKTLTVDEAVMRFDLSGDKFMIFQGKDKKIRVIYRRDEDDNFGIIEVQT